jgi:hypothetical protein
MAKLSKELLNQGQNIVLDAVERMLLDLITS